MGFNVVAHYFMTYLLTCIIYLGIINYPQSWRTLNNSDISVDLRRHIVTQVAGPVPWHIVENYKSMLGRLKPGHQYICMPVIFLCYFIIIRYFEMKATALFLIK